jgi:lipoprotein-anchoring transpeptidase ErfK/SrfK
MTGLLRPRYGRIVALAASVMVTGTAVLAGSGVLPVGGQPSYAATDNRPDRVGVTLTAREFPDPVPAEPTTLPDRSGQGRRVVFDQSDQRVWLVRGDGSVQRTYPVSGSSYDNLDAGRYEVYSRSMHATGIEDSGTMRYMVRFAHGDTAAIGFHDIPVDEGRRVQTRAQLGTPLSHGCIRQWRPDAKAMWRFAQLGTEVVVTA